jgi:type II secretory pathway component HofQ
VLIYFAKTYKFNIVLDPEISGKVTCRLIRVPWDQALSVILRQHGLAMVQNGSVVSVIDLSKLK